ncbi:MAG: transpeptidase family protein [Prevotella sp.]|nr:transpeptidase family protein [Prevotella sp.]
MGKFNSKKIIPRYKIVAWLLTFSCVGVIAKAAYIMTAKKEYWTQVADRLKRDSVNVRPNRGNILSCNGELMASSIPEYKLFMDFQAGYDERHDSAWNAHRSDSIWNEKVDSVCEGLHDIFPAWTAQEFKKKLEEGRRKKSRHWVIWPRRISYDKYQEVKALPLFRESPNKSGFHTEEYNARRRPFGDLGGRTVGEMYGAKDSARMGLEQSYDSILRGTNGVNKRRKVLNKYMSLPVTPPIDGADIVTTIDVGIQDLAERALIEELKKPTVNGWQGVAIVMEVATGDIKAIVNVEKCSDGKYRERKNYAVSDLLEPGSVFKTASIMVALDDGVVDTTYRIDTGRGVLKMHGRDMKDHNWNKGGYGVINVARSLEVSSNIGVSKVIDDFYGKNPEKFVEGLYRVGIAEDLKIPLMGSTKPNIRKPKRNSRGQYTNWSKTALPWMSIGYETQVPPISTLTFYNAIANDGKMMRPRFVKQVTKNNKVLKEYPPEVIKEQIAKPATIKTMQTVLEHVVSQGLGKKAGSKKFKVAGKTGTAQISQGAGGYKSGQVSYLLSFAGFFPADKPRYSCIVTIKKTGLPASGGGMSGVVFHNIAEGIMARNLKMRVEDARDEESVMIPDVKNGNLVSASNVLEILGIKQDTDWNTADVTVNAIWGKAHNDEKHVALNATNINKGLVPDVTGMGARDAVYLMESRGMKVKLKGRGKVKSQSVAAGKQAIMGQLCELTLQ